MNLDDTIMNWELSRYEEWLNQSNCSEYAQAFKESDGKS